MIQRQQAKRHRRRGVILTVQGLAKLQQAKTQAEFEENSGHRYTLEALSERTGIAVDTLRKVTDRELGVDKQTLKRYFEAFKIVLEAEDYFSPESLGKFPELLLASPRTACSELELLEGQISLYSPFSFYIERPPIEADCYRAIAQPGSLIRIKAPNRMGKTSLMGKILHHAQNKGYRTVSLNLQLAEKSVLQNLDAFLQWFCASVSAEMELEERLNDYWDDLCGSNISCKLYFEKYLLANSEQPIVIALDDVDRLFRYPDLADNFFALLRVWHEEANNKAIWQKLRLIVVHSTVVYIPLNFNQSPFNVGVSIELPGFTLAQIAELANCYQLSWSNAEGEQLMKLVGGNPYLIHFALYQIYSKKTNLEQLFTTPITSDNHIYKEHLQRQLLNLQRLEPDLLESFASIVMAERPLEMDMVKAFKLQSLGLIQFRNNKVLPSCQLYRQFFREYFDDFPEAI